MNLLKSSLFWMCAGVLAVVSPLVAQAQVSDAPIKLGLWETQVTSSTNMSLSPDMEARIAAMPPAQQEMVRSRMGGKPTTSTNKSCVAKQESVDSMLNDAQQRPGIKCTFSNRSPQGFDISCNSPQGVYKGHTDIQRLSDEHVTATTHLTGEATGANGGTTNVAVVTKMDSKYQGADCGDVKPPAQ